MTIDFKDNRTRQEVERIYAALSTTIVALGGAADQTTLGGFRVALRGVPVEAIERACVEAMSTLKFVPRPIDIRRLAGEMTPEQCALFAWEKASSAVSALGAYKSVSFDDGVTNAVVRNLGGWPTFCDRLAGPDAEKWLRKEFMDAYAAMPSVLPTELCAPLQGISQATAVNGQRVPARIRMVRTGLPVNPAALPAPAVKPTKNIEPPVVAKFRDVNELENQ